MAQWSVYVVRCSDGSLYTGIATDVRRRISEHAQTNGKGAKYLRGKRPLQLVFVKAIGSRGLALRVESQIKKLPKVQKEELINQENMFNKLVEFVGKDLAGMTPVLLPRHAGRKEGCR
jgi:putative endonuclease